jgi:hypothetical protein
MPEIGGYFEEELDLSGHTALHSTVCLNSARGALLWLLPTLKPRHAWLPCYSCEVLYHPFQQLGIGYTLYQLDEQLRPIGLPAPAAGELLLYINYNDACRDTATELATVWQSQCIIDNTQAFFWQPALPAYSINSARKWMGVADGAYVYPPAGGRLPDATMLPVNQHYRTEHLRLRRQGRTAEGYTVFQENELLSGRGPSLPSAYSSGILQQANYTSMQRRRLHNFAMLSQALQQFNTWPLAQPAGSVPMYYPLLPAGPLPHENCWQQQLYVPRLWPEVASLRGANHFEQYLGSYLLPLPIDHRYSAEQMSKLILLVKKLSNSK